MVVRDICVFYMNKCIIYSNDFMTKHGKTPAE